MLRLLEDLVDPFRKIPETQHPKPAPDAWRFIASHLRPFHGVIAASLLFSLNGAFLEVWLVGYGGRLVDTLATTPPADLFALHGHELLLVAALALIGLPLLKLLREGLNDISFRPGAQALIGWLSHRHVLSMSVGWFQRDQAGRIASRVREVGRSATGVAYALVHTLFFVIAYILASALLMASVDARLVLPLLVWTVLYLALMIWVVPRFRAASESYNARLSALSGLLVDTYSNIDTVKLHTSGATQRLADREAFAATRRAHLGLQRIEVTINAGMAALGGVLLVGLVGQALVLWHAGAAPLGMVAAALALAFRINAMAEWLLDGVSWLFGSLGELRDALPTVAQPSDITDAADAAELTVSGGSITLRGVTHSYGGDRNALDGIDLEVAPGEKIGLVGRSGAGKSTLVKLLLRFFEAEAGTITLDGQDIRSITQDSLRQHFAVVGQDAALLHRSIRDNIALGRAHVPQADIEAAARSAQAHDFISVLRDADGRRGYDALVGDRGVRLSGGQRQRIAIARAILRNAPILVLDEATSALDSEVEAAIQNALYPVMEGRTVIAIAHRLSTIARLDRIVVLDEGRIAEQGTHEELLALPGIYAGLWARQSGGYLGSD